VLAATTAAASSAILGHENTNGKEPIVDELAEIEVEADESEEEARVYAWRVEQLSGSGSRCDCERRGVVRRLARDRPPGRAGLLA
jgi:hypothetical protein